MILILIVATGHGPRAYARGHSDGAARYAVLGLGFGERGWKARGKNSSLRTPQMTACYIFENFWHDPCSHFGNDRTHDPIKHWVEVKVVADGAGDGT